MSMEKADLNVTYKKLQDLKDKLEDLAGEIREVGSDVRWGGTFTDTKWETSIELDAQDPGIKTLQNMIDLFGRQVLEQHRAADVAMRMIGHIENQHMNTVLWMIKNPEQKLIDLSGMYTAPVIRFNPNPEPNFEKLPDSERSASYQILKKDHEAENGS